MPLTLAELTVMGPAIDPRTARMAKAIGRTNSMAYRLILNDIFTSGMGINLALFMDTFEQSIPHRPFAR